MEKVINAQGQEVRQLADYNPVSPEPNVIFDDSLYNELKGGATSAPPATNDIPNPDPTLADGGPFPGAAPSASNDQDVPQAGSDVVDPAALSATDPAPQEPQPTPVANLDDVVKEKTGGKFEKLDDLLALSQASTPKDFANEESKKIYEYLKEGKVEEVTAFLQQQQVLKEADTYSPDKLLQLKIQMTMPELSDEDMADEYADTLERYGLNVKKEDFLDDAEYEKAIKKGMRRLKADMAPFVEELKAFRSELKLPDLQPQAQAADQKSNELDEFKNEFQKFVSQNKSPLKQIALSTSVDKDVNIDHVFVIDDAQQSDLQKIGSDFWNDFKEQYTKDGVVDYQAIQRDRFIAKNFSKIVQSAMSKAYMQGKLGTVMATANATSGTPLPTSGNSQDATAAAARQSLTEFLLRS